MYLNYNNTVLDREVPTYFLFIMWMKHQVPISINNHQSFIL